ncbi:MAG: hypothetical protein AAGE65_09995 [Planctomycetota bacterium]
MSPALRNSAWWWLPVAAALAVWWSAGRVADQKSEAWTATQQARIAQALAADLLRQGDEAAAADVDGGPRRLVGAVQRVAESTGLAAGVIRSVEQTPGERGGQLRVEFAPIALPRLVSFLEAWQAAEPRVRVEQLALDAGESPAGGAELWSVEVRFAF